MASAIINSYSMIGIAIWMILSIVTVGCRAEEPSFPRRLPPSSVPLKNQYIIQFDDTSSGVASKHNLEAAGTEEATATATGMAAITIIRTIPTRNIIVAAFSSEEAAAKWKTQTIGIKYFEEDSVAYLDRIGSERQQERRTPKGTPYNYGFAYVKAEEVSDDNAASMKVCVIDSGYDLTHPDLPADTLTPRITGESFVPGYDWGTDENSHGTHVAGIIAAEGQNSAGVKGIIRNGELNLHIVKVFDESGTSSWSSILAGFESCVTNAANIINMSLGGSSSYQSFQDAIQDAYLKQRTLIFASAGNSPPNGGGGGGGGSSVITEYNYPASYEYVTSVGSINSSYSRSTFSTYNNKVDIYAPGSSIKSTVPGDGYAVYSGTSMACSYATGVTALVWSSYPMISHSFLIHTLETTATHLPLDDENDSHYYEYGHGLIDAKKGLNALRCSIHHSKNACSEDRTSKCIWLEEWKVCSSASLSLNYYSSK